MTLKPMIGLVVSSIFGGLFVHFTGSDGLISSGGAVSQAGMALVVLFCVWKFSDEGE